MIRLREGGCIWRHGGNIPRCLSTINIFLISALLLTSKITSKLNSTLLSLLVALTVLYHEFVSLCNSSPAILHTKYVLYEPSFIMACQLLTVSLFSLEL